MYAYHQTTRSHLERILVDGLPISDRLSAAAHNPTVIWLAENANPNAPSPADRELAAHTHPGPDSRPPSYSWNMSDFARDRDIRVKVRIRREQRMRWLWWATSGSDIMPDNVADIQMADDGWFVTMQAITPNQITGVDIWSTRTDEWLKLELSRRLVLPAVALLVPPHRGNNVRRHVSLVYPHPGRSIHPATHTQNGV